MDRGKLLVAVVLILPLGSGVFAAQRFRTTPLCNWSPPVRIGPAAQRVGLFDAGSGFVILSHRREPTADGGMRRVLALHGVESGALQAPVMPDEYEAALGAVTGDGLRLLWTANTRGRRGQETASSGERDRPGLYTTLWNGTEWTPSEPIYDAGDVRAENASGIVVDRDGRLHFVATGYVPGSRLPKLLHMSGGRSEWSTVEVPVAAAFYPKLAALPDDGLVLVSIGPVPNEVDANSVWSSRLDRGSSSWSQAVLISRSGLRAAYEPALLVFGTRVDVVWTKDVDGDRMTREALWHVHSLDGGRTWSPPVQVAVGRHIWRPVLITLADGAPAVVYLLSDMYGSAGTLYMASLLRGRWRLPRRLAALRASDFDAAVARTGELILAVATFHSARGISEPGS